MPPSERSSATVTPSLTDHAPSPPRTTAGPARKRKPRASRKSCRSGLKVRAVRSGSSPAAGPWPAGSGTGRACVTGAFASAGRKRTGTGSCSAGSHGPGQPAATVSTGSGTGGRSSATVRPWSASTRLPHAAASAHAEVERQRLGPLDLGDVHGRARGREREQAAGRVDARVRVREADGGALGRVGIGGRAGRRAAHLGEHEHVAGFEIGMIAGQRGRPRAARQVAVGVAPGPEREVRVRGVEDRGLHGLERLGAADQRLAVLRAAGHDDVRDVGDARQQRRAGGERDRRR